MTIHLWTTTLATRTDPSKTAHSPANPIEKENNDTLWTNLREGTTTKVAHIIGEEKPKIGVEEYYILQHA